MGKKPLGTRIHKNLTWNLRIDYVISKLKVLQNLSVQKVKTFSIFAL